MNKLLNDLDSGIEVKTEYGVCYAYIPEIVEKFRQTLQRLEAIDNANPSEALQELNILQNALDKYLRTPLAEYVNLFDCINTIKQYILKAQQPKQYLKWEDLEFKEETTYENVKMGEHIYELKYWKYKDSYKDFMGNDIYYYEKFVYLRGHQIECTELFNDLHLERVEK